MTQNLASEFKWPGKDVKCFISIVYKVILHNINEIITRSVLAGKQNGTISLKFGVLFDKWRNWSLEVELNWLWKDMR